MTREDITTERALKLHDLALSLVRASGRKGSAGILEYRHGLLDIEYRAERQQLDVWFDRRVLTVGWFRGKAQVLRYTPGHWELDLIRTAKVAA